jgi:hypothetical protein
MGHNLDCTSEKEVLASPKDNGLQGNLPNSQPHRLRDNKAIRETHDQWGDSALNQGTYVTTPKGARDVPHQDVMKCRGVPL